MSVRSSSVASSMAPLEVSSTSPSPALISPIGRSPMPSKTISLSSAVVSAFRATSATTSTVESSPMPPDVAVRVTVSPEMSAVSSSDRLSMSPMEFKTTSPAATTEPAVMSPSPFMTEIFPSSVRISANRISSVSWMKTFPVPETSRSAELMSVIRSMPVTASPVSTSAVTPSPPSTIAMLSVAARETSPSSPASTRPISRTAPVMLMSFPSASVRD